MKKILESTLIGQTVAKLKKHSNENVVNVSKEVLNTWRNTLKQASQQKKPAVRTKSNPDINSPTNSQNSQSSSQSSPQPEEIVSPTQKAAALKKKRRAKT